MRQSNASKNEHTSTSKAMLDVLLSVLWRRQINGSTSKGKYEEGRGARKRKEIRKMENGE